MGKKKKLKLKNVDFDGVATDVVFQNFTAGISRKETPAADLSFGFQQLSNSSAINISKENANVSYAAVVKSMGILKAREAVVDVPSPGQKNVNWSPLTNEKLISPPENSQESRDRPTLGKWKKNLDIISSTPPLATNIHNRNDSVKSKLDVVAIDCEYVGVGDEGLENMLARVSIVDLKGMCIYDKYAKPTEEVVDYRTEVSGIRPENVKNGIHFNQIQQEVRKILNNKIVVGHSIHNDFKVLCLTHPPKLIRDTAKYKPLREPAGQIKKTPSLKHLALHLLGTEIQQGEHDSVTDARIALNIYLLFREKWDKTCKGNGARPAKK